MNDTTVRDPRWYQIAVLGSLLLYAMVGLQFDQSWGSAAFIISATVAVQWLATLSWKLPRFDPKSALISSLSLCLLFRTNSDFVLCAVILVTVLGKFLLRWNGKHLFNPTNLGIASALLFSNDAWVSPGQWGSVALLAAFLVLSGSIVVTSARRLDITFTFLVAFGALLVLRAWRLGDPPTIPLHQIQSGAILIFSFFMISDPKSTPDSPLGRIAFGIAVASAAYYFRFFRFDSNGLMYALILCSFLTPLLDYLLPGKRFEWPGILIRSNRSNQLLPSVPIGSVA